MLAEPEMAGDLANCHPNSPAKSKQKPLLLVEQRLERGDLVGELRLEIRSSMFVRPRHAGLAAAAARIGPDPIQR